MCLAIPGKVVEIFKENGLLMGHVDYSGTVNKICLEYVPEIVVGQYTVVHAGFACRCLTRKRRNRALRPGRNWSRPWLLRARISSAIHWKNKEVLVSP